MPDRGSAWTGGGLVGRTSGRVFFKLGGAAYTCSAVAADSPDRSTVVTAAHCVAGGSAGYATDWVFVPGYVSGTAPYGVFPATHFVVGSEDPLSGPPNGTDWAVVNVGRNASGQLLEDTVGGQPVRFTRSSTGFTDVPDAVDVVGYPGKAPYDGSRLVHCAGTMSDLAADRGWGVACGMTAGSSGGPWLADLDPATGRGEIVGVTSFGNTAQPGRIFACALPVQATFDEAASTTDR